MLARKDRSVSEIRDKLQQKDYSTQCIESIIVDLKNCNYLDDYKYALALTHDKQKFAGAGKNLLKQKLFSKGISKEIIEKIISEETDDFREYERAKILAIKKLETSYQKDDSKAKVRKLSGFLLRKGYSYDIVNKILRELKDPYII